MSWFTMRRSASTCWPSSGGLYDVHAFFARRVTKSTLRMNCTKVFELFRMKVTVKQN